MPYISDHEGGRDRLRPQFMGEARTTGELNFQITCLFVDYLESNGLHYDTLSECRAAAFDAAAELYRVLGGPYESKKIQENGHVYPDHLLREAGAPSPARHQQGEPT